MKISIIGLGFVGEAMYKSFIQKGVTPIVYDKYKYGCGVGTLEETFESDIMFLALPTQFSYETNEYDKTAIHETLSKLNDVYRGSIVIKSTLEPSECEKLAQTYCKLNIIHNPEFLTARTASKDFHYQKHIVLGKTSSCDIEAFNKVISFYEENYKQSVISKCKSCESECMKIFCNDFYATKVQIFNEFFLLCKSLNVNYSVVVDMMLKNGWINPMHTNVPGPDGQLSYGGACFPKDTNALNGLMKRLETPHHVLQAVIDERNTMREDNDNVI